MNLNLRKYTGEYTQVGHIGKRKHRTQKTNKQAKSVERKRNKLLSTKSTEKDNGLQVQYKESYIDRKTFFT